MRCTRCGEHHPAFTPDCLDSCIIKEQARLLQNALNNWRVDNKAWPLREAVRYANVMIDSCIRDKDGNRASEPPISNENAITEDK